MKIPRLLTSLAAALLGAISASPLPAADVTVDISSFAPHDPNAILRQIQLNVALKQYEKALTQREEDSATDTLARAEIELEMRRSESLEKEGQAKIELLSLKRKLTEARVDELAKQIFDLISQAYKVKQDTERLKLQGKWEGVEVGREAAGKCTLTINGDTIRFEGANKDEWYKTSFEIPDGAEPRQLRATITECPNRDFVGKTACSIYCLTKDTLTLVGHAPGVPNAPKSLDGDQDSRKFIFKKVEDH
jgi:uncharacterized protein (TIGR03067 family)